MKRIGVLTSGGDAPGMNACIRAIARRGPSLDLDIVGIERGYEGLIAGEMRELGPRDVSDMIQRGGTVLKTARSENFMHEEGFKMALNMVTTFKLDGIIVIGGNGSLNGAIKLAKAGVPVIGLPGTIDNDLPFTDYTIGFDTAVNTVLSAIGNIRDTSNAHERTTIIEVMGRECGDIAIYAGLTGGAEIILVPENKVDIDDVCRVLIEGKNVGKSSSIILKAEGVAIDSTELEETIQERTGLDTKVVILGYIQRGGSPTAQDRMLASLLGNKACELFSKNIINKAIGFRNGEIEIFDIEESLLVARKNLHHLQELAKVLAK